MGKENIKQTKTELLDCIHNLMSLVDSPVGRLKITGELADLIRNEANKILTSNNRSIY